MVVTSILDEHLGSVYDCVKSRTRSKRSRGEVNFRSLQEMRLKLCQRVGALNKNHMMPRTMESELNVTVCSGDTASRSTMLCCFR